MAKVLVEVSRRHIKQGNTMDSYTCPVALALTDAGIDDAIVYTDRCSYRSKLKRKSLKLPRIAKEFILKFDDRSKVEPFTFAVEVEL